MKRAAETLLLGGLLFTGQVAGLGLLLGMLGLRRPPVAPGSNKPPPVVVSGSKQHYRESSTFSKLFAAPPIGNELSRAGWKASCDSFEPGYECGRAIDGTNGTFWHTRYEGSNLPHQIVVDFGSAHDINGISALPRQDGNNHGFIAQHEVAVSADGRSWETVAAGAWYGGDDQLKYANFETRSARYVRVRAVSEAGGNPWTSLAELKAYGASSGPAAYGGVGKWGPTIDFPTVPVAAAVDPVSGSVLVWSSYTYDNYLGSPQDRVFTSTWDPATGSVTPRLVDSTDHDMFCPGISVDGTGKMVVTGGNSASKTTLYDFASGSWAPGPDMKVPRGYQASATLSDGRVFTIGGCWSGGWFQKNGEVYDPKAGTWTGLPGALVRPMLTNDAQGVFRADNHGWLFGWKNGSVFQAGPSAAMNWYATAGGGSVTGAGPRRSDRGDDGDAMNGNAVMYDATQGAILAVGGAPSYQSSRATAHAHLIRIADPGSPAVVRFASAGMWSPRSFANAVVLPDGTVFVTGGQSYAVPFSDDTAQLTPELYDSAADSFRRQQPNSIARVYHSVALLLPDARVLSAGGGLCGDCTTNHFDGQVFTPQYLLTPDGRPAVRPVIRSATLSGRRITVAVDSPVSSAALLRFGTATHTVNTDQRRVPLTLAAASAAGRNTYVADAPSDPGILLPGYYMLFVMNDKGVPSVSKTLRFLV
ncbi:Galactose oxidase, beta-propeller [Metarhizium album ARSEF 1941]|uniref:Galactose oxidase, beta-propeller n=1 Tax=Metarhizium album (strain ARSEF 1941) TaxID=1081103 RepID=A0A0B2WM12_METAS|nr:Galactose oxidase, beta-propeller [Metarhizium album ARSEF 1941]KHN94055.1 Galactose oxidase, beta-propeller [Metarhizium album ARSEF 1941]